MDAIRLLRGTILAVAAGVVLGRPGTATGPSKNANEVADFFETYRAGAQAGNAEDQYNLGASYRWGVGVDVNPVLAAQWIRKAADQGYALAERTIGEMTEKGEGLPANRDEAVRWFRRAVRHGDPVAKKDLAALNAKLYPVTRE
jgi:hypothetical protein